MKENDTIVDDPDSSAAASAEAAEAADGLTVVMKDVNVWFVVILAKTQKRDGVFKWDT